MNQVSDGLKRYATIWTRNGPVAFSGDPCQYKISDYKAGVEITLFNAHARKGDWSATIAVTGREVCCNRHFEKADDAFAAAKLLIDRNDQAVELTVRQVLLSPGDPIFIVDGLPSTLEVWIRNFAQRNDAPDWRYQVRLTKDQRYPAWVSGGFINADDALNHFLLNDPNFKAICETSPLNYGREAAWAY